MKKVYSLILAFIVIIQTFTACSYRANYTNIAIENSDEISEEIRSAMINRISRFKISFSAYTLDEDGIKEIVDDLMEQAFYESQASNGGDYLRYQYGGYVMTHSEEKGLLKYNYVIRISPEYYSDLGEEEKVGELIEEAITKADIMEASDYEKIKWVHDFICENVSYDTVHKHTPGSGHVQSTAYSALYYHTALCQGYAVLCYRMLKELGIDNRIVIGNAVVSDLPEKHAWNIVRLDDKYYNLDVTMDDVDSSLQYFLKSDEEFEKNHTRDDKFLTESFYEQYPMSKESY